MLLDFEVTHCSRHCATSGRTFAPGEAYFSTLHIEGGATVRKDYSAAEWRGPAEGWTARPARRRTVNAPSAEDQQRAGDATWQGLT